MPLAVSVEVEPVLVRRRFDARLEAALYYVGLEALTNVQKHAPGARATLTLRRQEDGRGLVIEVHDNGPGFDPAAPRRGAGRQNMTDRLAAVGGQLRIESGPGSGTWVQACAPLPAEPAQISRPLRTREGK